MAGKRQDFLEGMQFKDWKVLEYIGRNRYRCKCLICGYERDIVGTFLKDEEIPGCKGCKIQASGGKDPKDLTGKTFGEWKVIKYVGKKKWLCECSCGVVKEVATYSLVHGDSKSCGHSKDSKFIDLTGKKFDEWTVIRQAPTGIHGETNWECRCSCGKVKVVSGYRLRHGLSKSCGHATTGLKDLTGQKFGNLTALHVSAIQPSHSETMWTCECSCGNIVDVGSYSLRSGNTRSCGCMKEELKQQTNLERYGTRHYAQSVGNRTPEQLAIVSSPEEFVRQIKARFSTKPSIKELSDLLGVARGTVKGYIATHGLEDYVQMGQGRSSSGYEREFERLFEPPIKNDRTILDGKEIDFYFPDEKIGVEFNGNYWHSELKKPKTYHQDKTLLAVSKGVRLIHFFEYEWNEALLKLKLINFLGKLLNKQPVTTIGARDCTIEIVGTDVTKPFMETFHLQGYAVSSIDIALKYNGDIVGIMTFGKPRFNSDYEYELIRLCWKSDVYITGGAQRLFRYFLGNFHPESIISYCDISKFSGKVYEQLGFVASGISKPNYRWLDLQTEDVLSRYKTQKGRLLEKGLGKLGDTEEEIMKKLGYVRIFDCGNARYIWNSK